MFCVECGKETPIFREGVCLNCYLKTHTLSNGPDSVDLPVCPHCNSFKYKNNWTSDIFGEVIRRVIKNTFKISKELKKVDINTTCQEVKDGMNCKVYISGFINDVEFTDEHDLLVKLKRIVCDVCSKKFGGYHEAIIQIRADNRKLSEKELNNILKEVEHLVENLRSKGNRALFITDIEEEHGGLNFFISDKGSGIVIVKKIQDLYGGTIKQSSKNIGMKDGKQLYRMTYLVRIFSYKKGDFIKFKDDFYKVNSIVGKKIKLTNLDNWEKTTEELKDIANSKIIGNENQIKEMIVISQNEKEIQIMNQESYEIKIIVKPKKMTIKSEKIKIVVLDDQYFIYPNIP